MITKLDLDSIRTRYEAFSQELERAYYLEGAGLSEEIHAAEIYERYEELSSLEFVRALRALGPGERAVQLLLESSAQSYLGSLTRHTTDEVLNTEASGAIVLAESQERMNFRSSAVALANEPNRARRRAISAERDRFIEGSLNPLYVRGLGQTWDGVRSLEFASYRSMVEELSGLPLGALSATTMRFLADTEQMYADVLAWSCKSKLGISPRDLERHDLAFLARASGHDAHFPAPPMVERILGFVGRMGLDPASGGRIRIDIEPRPKKSPRAFCSTVRIPDEVYLVIRPSGGLEDYKSFLHELGHALHFGYTDPGLAWEFRRLGDNSVTETYAMLFDHLLHDGLWLRKVLGIGEASRLLHHLAFIELMMLRRYSAKLAYELELHASPLLESRSELYSDLLTRATGARTTGATYLSDVDPFFYSARYLRAWMLQAVLAEALRDRFDEDWFLNPRAGAFLKELWSKGQAPSAEALAAELGEPDLTMDRLRRTLERTFSSSPND